MEYTVNALARLSGVSGRTLRYYDGIGLLRPARATEAGYRMYGAAEVDRLQQILFYREMGMPLAEIKTLLEQPGYTRGTALEQHLQALLAKRGQIDALIANVQKSIAAEKGEAIMSDKEKFEGFKQQMIDENEQKYGKEIREKYGDDTVDASNAKLAGMSEADYKAAEALGNELNEKLAKAAEAGDTHGDAAREVAELHKQWLMAWWPAGQYSAEAHKGLCQMYLDDARFKAYYDKIHPKAATFLRDAVERFC